MFNVKDCLVYVIIRSLELLLTVYKIEWRILLIHKITIIISLPTLLTESPSEALRTGALKRACLWDLRADASILTWIHQTWICDSA